VLWSTKFAWYVLPLRSELNLRSVLNLWSAFPLRYVEYDIWVACVNFPNLGDEGLESCGWMLKSYQHKLNNIKKARKIRIRAINHHWTNLNQIKLYQIIWASKPSKKMVGMNIHLPARVFHEFQPPVFPPGLLQARQKPQCLPGGWMAETKAHDKVTWNQWWCYKQGDLVWFSVDLVLVQWWFPTMH